MFICKYLHVFFLFWNYLFPEWLLQILNAIANLCRLLCPQPRLPLFTYTLIGWDDNISVIVYSIWDNVTFTKNKLESTVMK